MATTMIRKCTECGWVGLMHDNDTLCPRCDSVCIGATSYYIVHVWHDIEPELKGSYDTAKERDEAARKLKKEVGNRDGIFWLDILLGEPPGIGAYSAGFFEEEE